MPQTATSKPSLHRLLLVDDNEVNRLVFTSLLERAGYRVHVATQGIEALEMLDKEAYDLVLMDIHMPGLDGMEATRRLRASARENHAVPIIAITAAATPRDRKEYRRAGINGCLGKPVSPIELLSLVKRHLQG